MADDLKPYLKQLQAEVDGRLPQTLRLAGDLPPSLLEAMSYSLMAPGKRLRPVLVILAAEACGGTMAPALPAACAVEMIHTYSLIHDDLPAMDDDDLRRGLPTCHKKFGEALAILAGDALLTLAFQVLAECYPAPIAAVSCAELAKGAGAAGMVGGQVLDIAWETQTATPQLADLEKVHACKTGALFRACLRIGCQVAGGEKAVLGCLDHYGRCFGQLFQITDDLLDVESSTAQLGKRVQKDAERGKLTYPSFLGLPESRSRAEQLCSEARQHLQPLGERSRRLVQLVDYVLRRDH